jgi:hypothetical protein
MISALHVLTPQLENSIRHVLRSHGHDVSKLHSDMTQEDVNLSVLLDRFRPPMDAIFGGALVTDIDNVFNVRGGPLDTTLLMAKSTLGWRMAQTLSMPVG